MGNRNGDAADQNMDISDRISEASPGLTKNWATELVKMQQKPRHYT